MLVQKEAIDGVHCFKNPFLEIVSQGNAKHEISFDQIFFLGALRLFEVCSL